MRALWHKLTGLFRKERPILPADFMNAKIAISVNNLTEVNNLFEAMRACGIHSDFDFLYMKIRNRRRKKEKVAIYKLNNHNFYDWWYADDLYVATGAKYKVVPYRKAVHYHVPTMDQSKILSFLDK